MGDALPLPISSEEGGDDQDYGGDDTIGHPRVKWQHCHP